MEAAAGAGAGAGDAVAADSDGGGAAASATTATAAAAKDPTATAMLEKAVAMFKSDPLVPKLHDTAQRKYSVFCRNRTADLHIAFLALIGDDDVSWCNDATYVPAFTAAVPFKSKKDERTVSGGRARATNKVHGLVRYEYKGNLVEECRRDGLEHGLRVVCTQMGDIWIRVHRHGKRLVQLILNADLSEQRAVDDGGLAMLRSHLHLIRDCFATA